MLWNFTRQKRTSNWSLNRPFFLKNWRLPPFLFLCILLTMSQLCLGRVRSRSLYYLKPRPNRVKNLIQPIRSTTQIWVVTRHQYGFLRSFLRRHLAEKLAAASPNIGCFLRMLFEVKGSNLNLGEFLRYCFFNDQVDALVLVWCWLEKKLYHAIIRPDNKSSLCNTVFFRLEHLTLYWRFFVWNFILSFPLRHV